MTRRNFLKQSIGGGALLSLATPAVAQSARTLTMLTTDTAGAAVLANRVDAATGGALKIEAQSVSAANASTMLGDVSAGNADMCLTSLDAFLDINMAFGLFASMPFGMSTGELEGWVHASEGRDFLDMLGAEHDVTIHFAGSHGNRPIWSRTPLADLASLQGQNIGSFGLGLRALQMMGASNVVDLSDGSANMGDLDVIDGASVVDMTEQGLTNTFPHMTLANPNQPSSVVSLLIGNGALAVLSAAERTLVERACNAALADGRARAFHDDASAIAAAGAALTASPLPDDIWQALGDASQDLLGQIFAEGDLQASVVDAYVYFLSDIAGWSAVGEAAYYTGRKRLVSL